MSIRRNVSYYLAALVLLGMLLAQPAFAVVGTVSVSVVDTAGKPVAGASISLGTLTATTDDRGEAKIEIEEDTYILMVQHEDYAQEEKEIAVPGGSTAQIRIEMTPRLPPGDQQPLMSNGPPTLRVGAQIEDISVDKLDTQSGSLREVIRDNGQIVFDQTVEVDPELDNRTVNTTFGATVLAVAVTIPLLNPRNWDYSIDHGLGPLGGLSAIGLRQDGSELDSSRTQSSGNRRFHPTFSLSIGQGQVEVGSEGIQDPSIDSEFEDEGLAWTAGADLVWMLCEDCGWHIGGGYRYQSIGNLASDRQPPTMFQGVQTVTDRADFDYSAHQLNLYVGHGWARASTYGGVRLSRYQLDFRGHQVIDGSASAGRPLTSERTSTVDLESEEIEVLLGGLFQIRDSRFYGRVEGSTSGDTTNVSVGVTARLGR